MKLRAPTRPVTRSVAVSIVVAALALGACGSSKKSTPPATSTGPGGSPGTLLNRGLQEEVNGDLAGAERDMLALVKADPKNKYGYYNLGWIYQQQNRASDAESQYRLALTIDDKYEPALYNLAILRTNAGDASGAIGLYQRAVAANPKDANAHYNLGLLLRKNGRVAEGNSEVQKAVSLDPALANKAAAQGVPLPGK